MTDSAQHPMDRKNTAGVEAEIAGLRRAVAENPRNPRLLTRLGALIMHTGKWEQAVPFFRRALEVAPDTRQARDALARIVQRWIAHADAMMERAEFDQAIMAYHKAIAAAPDKAREARFKLGQAHRRRGAPEQALAAWRELAAVDPKCVPAYIAMGDLLHEREDRESAVAAYRKALAVDDRSIPAYRKLAKVYGELNRPADSLEMCRRILALEPNDIPATATKASMLEALGQLDAAYDTILPLIQRGIRDAFVVTTYGRICQRLEPPRAEALPLVEEVANDEHLAADRRVKAMWVLVHLHDALGHYEDAFAWAERLKALEVAAGIDHRPSGEHRLQQAIAAYTPERLARLPRASHGSELPIFIVGMLRSGTTLVEQILASHPEVYGAGELHDIGHIALNRLPRHRPYPACLDALTPEEVDSLARSYLDKLRSLAPQAKRVTDKMPTNFNHLGLIELLFPRARVIHCVRDPLDNCLSLYFLPYTTHTQSLKAVGEFYVRYRRIMEKWQSCLTLPILTLRYEDLLADPEGKVRELLEFCGLDWYDACMTFYQTERFPGTFSYYQVRKPLYTHAVGRHKNYARHLGPLRAALSGISDEEPRDPAGAATAHAVPSVPVPSRDEERAAPQERPQDTQSASSAMEELRAVHALRAAGRHDEAERACERIIEKHPDQGDALLALADIAVQRLKFDRAEALAQKALAAGAPAGACHYVIARAYAGRGLTAQAIASYQQAIRFYPDFAPAHNNLGNQLLASGHAEEAAAYFRKAIALKPDYALAHYNLANALRQQNRLDEAITSYRRALQLKPDYTDALNNLGNVLKDADRIEEAEQVFRRALEIRPDFGEALNNLGMVLKELNRLEESIAVYRRAVAVAPHLGEARFGLGLALLMNGEYREGWKAYEARWETTEFPALHRRLREPLWDGSDFTGKTLLLHYEQGFGDTLQFLRYVPQVAERGGEVVLEVQRPLLRLCSRFTRWARVIAGGEPRPRYDIQCPLLSLPLAFGTTLETIPHEIPYLHAEAGLVEKWKERLGGERNAFKVGLVWAGNPRQKSEPKRGIGLEPCLPLFGVPGVRWFSLQVGRRAADIVYLPPGTITDLSSELTDFAETAAVIANLDLVITTDTAVAHLSGALGHPTWVMLRHSPDWRWLLRAETTPWYPGMRLFRQPKADDWPAVVAEVRAALEALVAPARAQRMNAASGSVRRHAKP